MTEKEQRELDAWIAEHLFDFKWGHFGFVKDGMPELEIEPIYLLPADRIKSPTQGNANPFPHDRVAGWKHFGLQIYPRYTTDLAAAMLVLEKCIEKDAYATGSWIRGMRGQSLPLQVCLFAKIIFTQ